MRSNYTSTKQLTPRQQEALEFLESYQEHNDNMPTTRVLAAWMNVAQTTVLGHLRALAKHGYIERGADNNWRFAIGDRDAQP